MPALRAADRCLAPTGLCPLSLEDPISMLPPSATNGFLNLIGLALALAAIMWGLARDLSSVATALASLAAYGMTLAVLEIIVLKVHRRPSTGLDWSRAARPVAWSRIATKLAGLGATIMAVVMVHWIVRIYPIDTMSLVARVGLLLMPVALPAALAYFLCVDRRMREPEDGYYHAGLLLAGRISSLNRDTLRAHCTAWLVKGFFLPIMFVYLVNAIARLRDFPGWIDVVGFTRGLSALMIALELVIVCVGYLCTCRLLDSHIRSTNPFLWGWVVTLACYAPFNLVISGRMLQYRDGLEWHDWFGAISWLAVPWALLLLCSFGLWLWATVSFGLRWSNLTYRGVITHGPYRWFRHPDYLAKSVFFWLVNVPFLSEAGVVAACKACLMLLGVNALYWARAIAEERHLSAEDPDYVAYSAHVAAHGFFARLGRCVPLVSVRGLGRGGPAR